MSDYLFYLYTHYYNISIPPPPPDYMLILISVKNKLKKIETACGSSNACMTSLSYYYRFNLLRWIWFRILNFIDFHEHFGLKVMF